MLVISPSSCKLGTGLQVRQMQLSLYCESSAEINPVGFPIYEFVGSGEGNEQFEGSVCVFSVSQSENSRDSIPHGRNLADSGTLVMLTSPIVTVELKMAKKQGFV